MAEEKAKVVIKGDTKQAQKSVEELEGSFGKLQKGGAAVAAGFTAVAAAGAGLVAVMKESVKAFAEQDAANGRLIAGLQQTGTGMRQFAKAQIDIEKISRGSGVTILDNTNAFRALVAATGSATTATQDLGLANDIAAKFGMDVAASTKLVTKARLGDVQGLLKLGIATKEELRTMDKLSTEAERVAAALKLLEDNARGGAKATRGLESSLVALDESLGKIKVAVGAALAPDSDKGLLKLSIVFDRMAQGITSADKALGKLGPQVREQASVMLAALNPLAALGVFGSQAVDAAVSDAELEDAVTAGGAGGAGTLSGMSANAFDVSGLGGSGKKKTARAGKKEKRALNITPGGEEAESKAQMQRELDKLNADHAAKMAKLRVGAVEHEARARADAAEQRRADAEEAISIDEAQAQSAVDAADSMASSGVGLAKALGAPLAATAMLEGTIETARAAAAWAEFIAVPSPTFAASAVAHTAAAASFFAAAAKGGAGGGSAPAKGGSGAAASRATASREANASARPAENQGKTIVVNFSGNTMLQDSPSVARAVRRAVDEDASKVI